MRPIYMFLGRHLIAEFYGCETTLLDDIGALELLLLEAARRCGASPVKQEFHRFAPHGVSGVIVIAESHLTIHTWPEHGYAAVDFFTCGDGTDPMLAYAYLRRELRSTSAHHLEIHRGVLDERSGRLLPLPSRVITEEA